MTEREYEEIPQALPQDFGEIPPLPGVFDILQQYVRHEVEASGGIMGFLLFKGEDGKANYPIALAIYSVVLLILISAFYVLKEAWKEISGAKQGSTSKTQGKKVTMGKKD